MIPQTTGYTEIVKITESALNGDAVKAIKYVKRFMIKHPESDLIYPFTHLLKGENNPSGLGHGDITAGVRFAESEIGQIAQEFAEWCAKNDWHYNKSENYKSENYWCKVFHTDYTTPDLFAKFMAERNQQSELTCPECGKTAVICWMDFCK